MLVRMRKRMVELGIRQAPRVVGARQSKECNLATGELEQRRAHDHYFTTPCQERASEIEPA
jgi:hypothetical protein